MKRKNGIDLDLDTYNFANLFNIINLNEKSYFNLCKTIYFDKVDKTQYDVYVTNLGDTWTGISYKFYNTIKLWWLICKFNNIKYPFEEMVERIDIKNFKKRIYK